MANPKINFIIYTIRFREKGKKDNYIDFNTVFSGQSFIEFMNSVLDDFMKKAYVTSDKEKMLDILSKKKNENYIYGRLCKGVKYRTVNNIRSISRDKDSESLDKSVVIRTIGEDEYPTIEYFYLLCDPSAKKNKRILTQGFKDTGLLVTQSFENYGYKELFQESLSKNLNKFIDSKYICEMAILAIPELMLKYAESSDFRKLIFRKYSVPEDFNDIFDKTAPQEKIEVETILNPKGGIPLFTKNKLIEKIRNNVSVLDIIPGEYEDLSVELKKGRSVRIVSMSNPDRFGSVFDVTNEFKFNEANQIDSDSAFKIAQNILEKDLLSYEPN